MSRNDDSPADEEGEYHEGTAWGVLEEDEASASSGAKRLESEHDDDDPFAAYQDSSTMIGSGSARDHPADTRESSPDLAGASLSSGSANGTSTSSARLHLFVVMCGCW